MCTVASYVKTTVESSSEGQVFHGEFCSNSYMALPVRGEM